MFYRRFSRLLTQKLLRSVRKSFFTSIVMSSCRDWRIRLAIIFSTTAHDPPSHDVTLNISYIHCTTALMCISLIKLIKVWSTFFLNNSLREQTKKYFSQIFCKWLCSLVCVSGNLQGTHGEWRQGKNGKFKDSEYTLNHGWRMEV